MAGEEEALKVFLRDLQTIFGQAAAGFDRVREIRMRTQKPLLPTCGGREHAVKTDESPVMGIPDLPARDIRGSSCRQEQGRCWARAGTVMTSQAQMKETVKYMCSFLLYVAEGELRQGFATIRGGHRIGVAGRTMALGQDIQPTESIPFTNIWVAHRAQGCANQMMEYLYSDDGRFLNTLVISPSRCGKITLLRDTIRRVSDGPRARHVGGGIPGVSVGVVGERSELGARYQGVSQSDLGTRIDILDCCPRSQGMTVLVRPMTPQAIAVDEIGSREDAWAIEYTRSRGYSLAATIHGSSLKDVMQKPAMRELIHQGVFGRMILLDCWGTVGHVAPIWDGGGNVLCADGGVREAKRGNI